ncbi:MAG TPA: sugar phosphate isomerase/epimerase family protein [Steroidobacteraceae bacterium]|nr:sugar phosphate isomerase/epimerase family protein [Steroidobacteraceae bacterium]
MSNVELIASYWTLAGGALPHTDKEYSTFEFKERVEAAARAGFKGIGLWHADLEHVQKTYTLPQMKRILDDNGMKHIEIEFLADWFLPPGERRAASDQRRQFLFDACEGLGARHLKVGDFYKSQCPMPRLIDEFANLCRDAARRGIRIVYELMPFSVVESLEATRQLVQGAAQKNGGVIFDLWHIVKLGIPYDEVMRFPGEYFFGLELNDGYLRTPPGMDLVTETTSHRKLCGQGEFDIKGFTGKLSSSAYRGPVGIEVLSQELRSWPLEKTATTAFNTTRAQFS